MSAAPIPLPDFDRPLLMTFSVEQYREMITAGFLPEGEPYELLNGLLTRKERQGMGEDIMTVNPEHSLVVKRLAKLDARLGGRGCFIQTQQPIFIPPSNQPEPDGAIVLGAPDDFADRHPAPGDVLCVIEVAAASLRRDRTVKLEIYATAKIPMYVIVNLVDKVVEVYTKPMNGRYGDTETLSGKQKLELPTAKKTLSIAVVSLLPK